MSSKNKSSINFKDKVKWKSPKNLNNVSKKRALLKKRRKVFKNIEDGYVLK